MLFLNFNKHLIQRYVTRLYKQYQSKRVNQQPQRLYTQKKTVLEAQQPDFHKTSILDISIIVTFSPKISNRKK